MREFEADYASLCFLSYKRPQFILEAVYSAVQNAGYPVEVIVHDDGSDADVIAPLLSLLDAGYISHLILNPKGHNEGVGESIRRMFDMAQGDPVIKLDQDMVFKPHWLHDTMTILREDENVGMFGFFKYNADPVDWRKKIIRVPTKSDELIDVPGYHYTRQFCGSGFAIPRHVFRALGPLDTHLDAFNEDSNYMEKVRVADKMGWELALPDEDFVTNRGFGIGPSTVVEEGYVVHKINHGPHVIRSVPRTEQPGTSGLAESGIPVTATAPAGFKVGVVITFCEGREENVKRLSQYLMAMTLKPEAVVLVGDGVNRAPVPHFGDIPWRFVPMEKYEPSQGMDQPRNVGARILETMNPPGEGVITHVWFVDSDMIVPSDTLEHYATAWELAEDRILIGPYDWLPQNVVGFVPEMKDQLPPGVPTVHGMADHRWDSFKEHGPAVVHRHSLGMGLACFGGNLIWPLKTFLETDGFHTDLYHGRCEDGEFGLRACELGIPMSMVRDARLWHVWHPINQQLAMERNDRDVPLLNAMHPWVQNEGLRVVEKDGHRFDWECPKCGEVCNSLDYWPHAQVHLNEND